MYLLSGSGVRAVGMALTAAATDDIIEATACLSKGGISGGGISSQCGTSDRAAVTSGVAGGRISGCDSCGVPEHVASGKDDDVFTTSGH